MPITPIHMAAGGSAKGLLNRHFSFVAFVMAQIVTDLEPLWYYLAIGSLDHRFFHTYLGATGAALIAAYLAWRIHTPLWSLWNRHLGHFPIKFTRYWLSPLSSAIHFLPEGWP
jgi:hypothetical protein